MPHEGSRRVCSLGQAGMSSAEQAPQHVSARYAGLEDAFPVVGWQL